MSYFLLLDPLFMPVQMPCIETLSGFANGLFLILVSVFIVFAAVQRLLVSILILVSGDANHSYRLDPGDEHEPAAPDQLRRLGSVCLQWETPPPRTYALAYPNPELSC